MVRQLLLSFLLTSATSFAFAQVNKTDSTKVSLTDSIPKKKKHDIFIGVDLFNPIVAAFKDKKGASIYASYQINTKWHAVIEAGFEKNKFDEIHWNVDVDGIFAKAGANWFITQDVENQSNGIYIGGRVAYSKYSQTVNSYPIRDLQSNEIINKGSLPKANVSSYWIEAVIGGRVEIFKNFYGELALHPAAYIGGKKDQGIEPLIVPGYGKYSGPFNMPVFWGIAYKIK
ncbi:hypothetical protein HX001_05310 [Empedobacter brevis]|uniref:DUF3575 domain-containing protein n=1 Tax=Empedobacter brevis TaxID=247 RepID=A0AAJ1V714_9FLAO|nr:DUF6048 family protein [Empedobacter brevis]MDM1071914.1 hypothetical protein [Empedobacter brevis]